MRNLEGRAADRARLLLPLLTLLLIDCTSAQAVREAPAAPAANRAEAGRVSPPAAETASPASASVADARASDTTIERFFDALGAGHFSLARGMFDRKMQDALSTEQLGQVWSDQTHALGPLKSLQPDAGLDRQGKRVYSVDLSFERGALIATLALDSVNQEIAGLFFRPGRSEGTTAPYSNPAAFHGEEMSVGKAPFILGATLTLPLGKGPFPALLLVHGSGPLDRDETVIANKPFKDLAEGLASRGVAVLRYDKRTFAHAARVGRGITIDDEVVLDATYALEALRARPDIDPQALFVVGHSLGALLAPEIAKRAAPVTGVVLLAPPGRPPWEVIVDQMRYLGVPAELLAATEKSAAAVKSGTPGSDLLGIPLAYWQDLASHDGVATSRQLRVPLLILRGARDYQVTDADIEIWRNGLARQPDVTFETLPADNHLFVPGSGKPGPAEYATPGHVDEAVVTRLAAFVQRIAPAAPSATPGK